MEAWPGTIALALGSQVLNHLVLPHQTWPNWVEQPIVEEGKASPSYAIVRDARGCREVIRTPTSALVQTEPVDHP